MGTVRVCLNAPVSVDKVSQTQRPHNTNARKNRCHDANRPRVCVWVCGSCLAPPAFVSDLHNTNPKHERQVQGASKKGDEEHSSTNTSTSSGTLTSTLTGAFTSTLTGTFTSTLTGTFTSTFTSGVTCSQVRVVQHGLCVCVPRWFRSCVCVYVRALCLTGKIACACRDECGDVCVVCGRCV